MTKHLGERIRFITVEHGSRAEILGCETTFFDIFSTKAKQFGFTLKTKEGVRLTCAGDEPYNAKDEGFIKGSDWLMHEAFCLYSQRETFKPYEKHHSTVKDACMMAEELGVSNLILYHTEDKNLEERKRLYTEEGKAYYSGNLLCRKIWNALSCKERESGSLESDIKEQSESGTEVRVTVQ